MTTHQISPDTAAVARLTDKERECLRLWLGHATAKEIAIRLGITHHAVEKRLKSARNKLDVNSSLEAARIFARTERYDGTISGSPELSDRHRKDHHRGHGVRFRLAAPRIAWHRLALAAGVPIMSMLLVMALTLSAQPGLGGDTLSADGNARLDENIEVARAEAQIAKEDAAWAADDAQIALVDASNAKIDFERRNSRSKQTPNLAGRDGYDFDGKAELDEDSLADVGAAPADE